MPKVTLIFLVVFLQSSLYSQKDFILLKADESNIIIDGVLSEYEKSIGVIVPVEYEQEPGDNTPTKVKTDVYVTYTDTFLYFGIKAYADPQNIRGQIRPRDKVEYQNEDIVFIRFDPFKDARANYIIGANAYGSQLDIRVKNATTEEETFDPNYNAIYETKSNIVSDGYILEFKIPLNSIPYPKGGNQIWHFNLSRVYTLDGIFHRSQSQRYDRNDPCWACQVTDKLIMKDVVYKRKVELLPYISGNLSGERESSLNDPINFEGINGEVGLGVSYDLSSSASLELTINPDFSQVEADRTQLDINSAYALQYPELRPFFNKGMDLLKFMDGAFYSRTINSPSISSKIINQGESSGSIMLTAIDQTSPYLIGGEDKSYIGDGAVSYVNAFRHQKLFNSGTKFGAFTTNRFYEGGGYGNLFGIDGLITINKIWRIQFELIKNFNKEPIQDWIDSDDTFLNKTVRLDGEKFSGSATYFRFSRQTEHWDTSFFYRGITPGYRADVGFTPKNNRKWLTFSQGYEGLFEEGIISKLETSLKGDITYNYDNDLKSRNLDFDLSFVTVGKTEISYNYDINFLRNYLGVDYKNVGKSGLMIIGFPTSNLTFATKFTFGREIAYNEDIPEIGRERSAYIALEYKIGENINIQPSINYAKLERLNKSDNFFSGYISRLAVRYQFNNDLSFRIISEYNNFNETFFIQPLLKWNPNPSTIFYIGGNQNSIHDFNVDPEDFDPMRVNQSQFFVKFQYLIGL